MQCSNCAGALAFDPGKGKLVCKSCGGEFEVTHTDDKGLVDINSVFEDTDEITREDINVYTCSTCGGSIAVNDVEMTSSCPFCGNSGVIFDRVAKRRRPDGIIPFVFDSKSAQEKVRDHLKGSAFLPKKAKEMPFVNTVGVYIPYYIVSAESRSKVVYQYDFKDNEGNVVRTEQLCRTLRCFYDRLIIEASAALTNAAANMTEPYDLAGIRVFEEGYLQGFYSDMADEDPEELLNQADKRIREYETSEFAATKTVPDGYYNIAWDSHIKYKGKAFYALFPMWFVRGEYNGKNIIMLVNGQTGKVVGGPEYSKKMFTAASLSMSVLPIIGMTVVGALGSATAAGLLLSGSIVGFLGILAGIIGLGSAICAMEEKQMAKIRDVIDLSSSRRLVKFISRRKG